MTPVVTIATSYYSKIWQTYIIGSSRTFLCVHSNVEVLVLPYMVSEKNEVFVNEIVIKANNDVNKYIRITHLEGKMNEWMDGRLTSPYIGPW